MGGIRGGRGRGTRGRGAREIRGRGRGDRPGPPAGVRGGRVRPEYRGGYRDRGGEIRT